MQNFGAPDGAQLARGRSHVRAGDQRDMGRAQANLSKGPGAFSPDEDTVAWLKYVADVGRGFNPGDNDMSALGRRGFNSIKRIEHAND